MKDSIVGIRECPQEPASLEAVLAAYEAETRALPLGAASREKGDSAYNWRMSVVKDLRELAARIGSGQNLADANSKKAPTP